MINAAITGLGEQRAPGLPCTTTSGRLPDATTLVVATSSRQRYINDREKLNANEKHETVRPDQQTDAPLRTGPSYYYAPDPRVGALGDDARLTSVYRVHRA